ncbi:MAG TPA: DNA mismatch repair endonuclease MutL [Pirellulales bacterium]|jgi:DNA mismatch repair protein MutL|nr:DNA mismatch repair endonuclease MutL [Pirellulales bacterium]
MPTIRQLSPSVVNKIAAGEVIERPASVVKELMENSVDAGAHRIDVAIEQGGLELVRVADDGRGIAADELPLAVASHATSKLRDGDDLFRVATLGFRGEALASIAEVSRLVLRSRTDESTAGAQLEVAAGHSQGVAPCGCPRGTTVEVRQLFYNTPVRRKFLRGTQTEMGHIAEAFTRLALANPHVHCTLRHNDRVLHDLAPTDDLRVRVAAFFGADLARDLIAVSSQDGQVRLAGYVANPTHSRSNPRMQYLFLNGRAIRDRALQHALGEAYRGLLLVGRYPIAFLSIDMPAELVDVNVHPTKLEVRFQESGRLYSQLLGTLRTQFLKTDLTVHVQPPANDEGAAAHDTQRTEQLRRELVDWAKGQLAGARPGGALEGTDERPAGSQSLLELPHGDMPRSPLELISLGRRWQGVGLAADDETEPPELAQWGADGDGRAATGPALGGIGAGGDWTGGGAHARNAVTADSQAGGAAAGSADPQGRVSALQIHNRYLITESEEGVVVIDQHALHERILYEHLREKVLAGALESQALLVPEPVDLGPAEAAAALGAREVLARLGLTVEPFGGDTVLVSSYPAMLANLNLAEILRAMVDRLLVGEPAESEGRAHGAELTRRDVLDELLHMISCKAAIKAGDRLTPEEIAALLQQRHLARDTHHCPHGRPTALVFTREELDRQFKRKG